MTETNTSLGVTDRSVRAVVAVVEAGSFTGAALTLGWEHIARELLDQGRLAAVGLVVETGIHFPLLSRHDRLLSPAAETRRTWILANAPG